MRNLLIIGVIIFGAPFPLIVGYALKTLVEDFGVVVGLLGTLTTVSGFVLLGFLVDSCRRQEQTPRVEILPPRDYS